MVTKREKILSIIMIFVQMIMTLFVFYFIEHLFPQPVFHYKQAVFFYMEIALIWGMLLYSLKLGTIFRNKSILHLIRGYVVIIVVGITIIFIEIVLFSLVKDVYVSSRILVTFALADFMVLISFKVLFYKFMLFWRSHGHNSRHIVIIADASSLPFIRKFRQVHDWGYHLVAVVTKDVKLRCDDCGVPVYSDLEELSQQLPKHPVDDIFYCLPVNNPSYDIESLIQSTNEIGIDFHLLEEPNVMQVSSVMDMDADFDDAYTFKTISKAPHHYLSIKLKELLDIVTASIILTLTSPLFVVIALIIKGNDGGPVFFKQERIGKNGRRFMVYKFRTMVVNAEALLDDLKQANEADGPVFKIENDPRITPFGKFLRKTSLDEFPQFYNVIKGDMSIVGPRPPLLREVQQYKRAQLRRLSMKPGITCIWQVKGRHTVSFEEWMRMDLAYIDHWSLWLDFKLIIATIGVVLKANGQ